MTIITQKWTTALHLGLALIWAINSYQSYQRGDTIWASILALSVILYLVLAFTRHRQTWEITKEGKIFKVIRNQKILFEGRSMDLGSVETDHFNYFIHPLKGSMIQVPKKAANEVFLDLIKSRDRKAADS